MNSIGNIDICKLQIVMQLTEIFFKSIEFISQNISEKSTKPKFYVQIYKKNTFDFQMSLFEFPNVKNH